MTAEEKEMLNRINEYAKRVLKDTDSQKSRISYQLDKLKPVMEEIAKEQNVAIEDIFVKYMDLASQVTEETKFLNTVSNIMKYNDEQDLTNL